ncbi:regulator of G-protein signaling 6-like, partial [Salvelinus sp. IW2-2015]|uniref:regulator of G-protein signaling 6-like n=1 Tax=Salvelinus sp. IW2-2015 TaxID=2691554 RepID=UPI0038D48968
IAVLRRHHTLVRSQAVHNRRDRENYEGHRFAQRHPGADIVQWLMKNLAIDDPAEAMHIGSLIAAQGYFFPISDHVLSLKDDGSFYRFQAPYFWPSNCWEPENTDYEHYSHSSQNSHNQETTQLHQERAFWDVHRPVPGCVNTTEMDIRKCRRMRNPQRVKKSVYGLIDEGQSQSPVHTPSQIARKGTKADVEKEVLLSNSSLDGNCIVCCVAFSLMSYTEQYQEYDPFVMSPEPSNPWTSDDLSFWDLEASNDPSQQRVRKWGFSLDEALKDPAGRDQFLKFLESEFSSENLQFWLAVQDLKRQPLENVAERAEEIWTEFLAEGASSSINLDSHSYERTSANLKDPGRYSYEDAQDHIYKLMKSDSYTRYLRSSAYQNLLMARKKVCLCLPGADCS